MKLNTKLGAAIATAATMIAVPAAALAGPPSSPGNSNHPSGTNHPNGGTQPAQSHKCTPHNRAYVEGGTVTAVTTDTTGAVTGITITVKHANHAAKMDPTTTVALSGVKVVFDGGTTALTTGEQVQLIGKIQTLAKKCTPPQGWAPTPTFRMIVVHPAPTPAG